MQRWVDATRFERGKETAIDVAPTVRSTFPSRWFATPSRPAKRCGAGVGGADPCSVALSRL